MTITFDHTEIFGANFPALSGRDHCIVTNILEHLELNGSVRADAAIEVRELWLYIYYLHKHNKDVEIFKQMSNDRTSASAQNFVSVVQRTNNLAETSEAISRESLVYFINNTINTYHLSIPILSHIANIVIQKLQEETTENQEMFEELQDNIKALQQATFKTRRLKASIQTLKNDQVHKVEDVSIPADNELVVKILANTTKLSNDMSIQSYLRQ